MPSHNSNLSPNLICAKALIYNKCGFNFSNYLPEPESVEYAACSFNLNGKSVTSRVSKITPTKTGQFVTLWKRNTEGVICPHHTNEATDLYVINCFKDNFFGQFVFPKKILMEKGILSSDHKKGKLGFRVYPAWDNALNKQAQQTQKWQLEYFIEIKEGFDLDLNLINRLYLK